MAKLRNKYYSKATNSYVDVPTSQSIPFSSTDVGELVNEETLRLIRYDSDVDSSVMDEALSDLLYNDNKLNDELRKLNSLLSDGTFYGVGENFNVYDVDTVETASGTFVTSFRVGSGQLKYGEEVLFLAPQVSYGVVSPVVGNNRSVTFSSLNNVTVGTYVYGSEFEEGTRVTSVVERTVTFNKPLKSTLPSASLVLTYDSPTFSVGVEIPNVTGTYQSYPVYRRDVVSYNVNSSSWNVTVGPELPVVPPGATQLDVLHQIESVTHVSGSNFRLKLRKNNRSVTRDFPIGQETHVKKTNNGVYDGSWNVVSVDSVTNSVVVNVLHLRDNSKDQLTPGGYVDNHNVALFSVLVYKNSQDASSLIFDEIKKVQAYSGLTGQVQNVIRTKVQRDESGTYCLKTKDNVHLVDVEGRLLDWEQGQDADVFPELGYTINENQLVSYDESQVEYAYKPVNEGNLSSVPFVLNEVANNVFGLSEVSVGYFKLGVKNNNTSIGNEGLTWRVVTFSEVVPERSVQTVSLLRDTDETLLKVTLYDPFYNYATAGVSVSRGDFVLVTSGPGSVGVGKVVAVGSDYLEVTGLYKPPTSASKYVVFNNTTVVLENSESYVTSENVRSQVLSGVSGSFGNELGYSKVSLTYSNVAPKVQTKKWYFLQLKGYNPPENPVNQGTPYLVVESPKNESTSPYTSNFVELYYRTLAGSYPNGNLLIEDDFGNLSNTYSGRSESPHFRPVRYQVVAKALDDNLQYPQDYDEVFVDVRSGRIKFHPQSNPLNLYVSYNKYDVLDGNSTDFSIKHVNPSTNTKENLQDTVQSLSERLSGPNNSTRPWSVNGLVSSDTNGVTGPLSVNPDNYYGLVLKDSNFSNHSYDEEHYVVKLSGHKYDNAVYVGDNEVFLENTSFEVTYDEGNNSFMSGELVANYDFLDASGVNLVSGVTLPQAGINFYDEVFLPSSNVVQEGTDFYKKKNTFELPNESVAFNVDSELYNSLNVSGAYNYSYVAPFDKNTVFYSLLRNLKYEELQLEANPDVKRRLKQKEVFKLLNRKMDDLEGARSNTVTVSQKHLSKSLNLDNIKHKENFLLLKSEVTKYKDYTFLESQDLSGLSFNLNNVQYNSTVSTQLVQHSTVYTNSTLCTFYTDTSSSLSLAYVNFSKSEEGSDVTVASNPTFVTLNSSVPTLRLNVAKYNENEVVVAHTYLNSTLNLYELKLFICNTNGEVVANSQHVVTRQADLPTYFSVYNVATNKVAVVWKKSATELSLLVYSYDKQKISNNVTTTEVVTVENQYSTNSNPSLCSYGPSSFLLAYSNESGVKLKAYSVEGKLEFFNNENTLEYRTVTSSYFANGNRVQLLELDDNNVLVSFLERDSSNSTNFVFATLDSYTKRWSQPTQNVDSKYNTPQVTYVVKNLNENVTDATSCYLNEDCFVVSYRQADTVYLSAYKNDGGLFYSSYSKSYTSGSGTSNVKLHSVGTETVLLSKTFSSTFNYSVVNVRPDYTTNVASVPPVVVTQSFSSNSYKNVFNYVDSNYLALVQSDSTNFSLSVVSTKNKSGHVLNSTYSPLNFNLENFQQVVDSALLTYDSNNTTYYFVLLLYTTSNLSYPLLKVLKVTSTQLIDSGTLFINTVPTGVTYLKGFGKLVQLRKEVVGVVLKTSTNRYNVHGVSLLQLENSNFLSGTLASNYTNDQSRVWNPTINVVSGVTKNFSPTFVNKDDTTSVIFYESNNSLVFSRFALPVQFYNNNDEVAVNLLSTDLRRNTVANASYGEVSFVVDSTNSNNVFLTATQNSANVASGTVSGAGHLFNVMFDNQYFNYTVASGVYFSASGTTRSWNVPFVGNTNSSDVLQVLYNTTLTGSSESSATVNLLYVRKSNLTSLNPKPGSSTLFLESASGNFVATKSNTYDTYVGYNVGSSFKALTLQAAYYGNELESEVVVRENVNGELRNRLYASVSLKLIGLDWRGKLLRSYPVYNLNSNNLDNSQVDSDGVFRAQLSTLNGHLVSTSKDSFTVVYYYYKEKDSETKFKLRNYTVSRGRVFPTSEWYSGNPEFSYEGVRAETHLQVLQLKEYLLYVWVDPTTKVIKRAVVDRYNNVVSTFYSTLPLNAGSWIVVSGGTLVDNWCTVLLYNVSTNACYTVLFNPDGELVRVGEPFTLPFDLRNTLRGKVTVTKYGYYVWTYLASGSLRYYQHGFDGGPVGLAQFVGRHYLTNLDVSPQSPITKTVKEEVIESNFSNVEGITDNSKALGAGLGLELLERLNAISSTLSGTVTSALNLIEKGKVPVGAVVPVVGTYSSLTDPTSVLPNGVIPNSGVISTYGYMLCDGSVVPSSSNVHPNFRGRRTPVINDGRFVSGSTASNPGSRGPGTLVLTEDNIPLHDHSSPRGSGVTGSREVLHTHSISHTHNIKHSHSISDPGHTHNIRTRNNDFNEISGHPPGFADDGNPELNRVWTGIVTDSRTGISVNEFNGSSDAASPATSGPASPSTAHTHQLTAFGKNPPDALEIVPKYVSGVYLIRVVD